METIKVARGTDDIRINTKDGAELKYWSTKFEVKKSDIQTAVGEVGESLIAVRDYFRSRP
jgi:predicted transcriptional regulator